MARLFIAVNFSAGTRSQLLTLREALHARSARGNFTLPENMHLTLVFLGECDAIQAAAVKAAMEATRVETFDIEIDFVGRFRRDGGDTWWAGVRENKPLAALQRALTDRLIDAGFRLDRRKYSPHITLGREVVTDAAPWRIKPFGETVHTIDLMKSERIQGKLTYTKIYTPCFLPDKSV